ncbi:MAG: signal peptide peptidase SppA [Candidatus Micrarchaeota archaeon]|nr:signal peptide peptidase SppA [Candidatus Micrarchaeota archaeon]
MPRKFNLSERVWQGIAIIALVGLVFIGLIMVFTFSLPKFGGKCIAVMEIEGPIYLKGYEGWFEKVYGAEDYILAIEEAQNRSDVAGLFVVINSPGGGVVASDIIYRKLRAFNKSKVAYIEEVGASGGYYVALGADKIYAHPNAITGSIGVIMYLTNYEGLMEKIGVNVTAIKSGPYKDIGSPYRELTPEEREILMSIINESYEQFKSILYERRVIPDKYKDLVVDGRVMTGQQALKYGLVDGVMTKEEALEEFAQTLNLTRYDTCELDTLTSPGPSPFYAMIKYAIDRFAMELSAGVLNYS